DWSSDVCSSDLEETDLPIMIYNIPGRTACNIEVDTIVKLSEIDNIVSVKEASGNLDAMAEIIERTKDGFVLYSGDDSLTLPVLAIGGKGIVSVAAHIVGDAMREMNEAVTLCEYVKRDEARGG